MIVEFLIVLWEHGAIIPLNMAGLSKAVAHEIAGANFPGSSLARDRREYLNTHTNTSNALSMITSSTAQGGGGSFRIGNL